MPRTITLPVTRCALGCAAAFLAVTAGSTQVRSVRVHSPWQDDPYNVVVSLGLVVVPALAALIGLRLLARRGRWGAPGAAEAEIRSARTALALLVTVDVTAAVQWTALALSAHQDEWTATTGVLSGGSMIVGAWSAVLTVLLLRRGLLRSVPPTTHDWLADVVPWLVGACTRRDDMSTVRALDAVRRHALLTFAVVSVLGGAVIVGALAHGEGWRDPWLIGWAFTVETATNFGACVVVNAVAGVLARPNGRRPRVEAVAVATCVSGQVAVLVRDPVWAAFTGRTPHSAADLIVLTAAAAVLTGVASGVSVTGYGRADAA